MLREIRMGELSAASNALLVGLEREMDPAGSVVTELYALRQEVNQANMGKLGELDTPVHEFEAVDTGEIDKLKDIMAQAVVKLRVGAAVMLIRNVDETLGLFNGTVGIVRGFYRIRGGRAGGVVRQLFENEFGDLVEGPDVDGKLSNEPYPYVEFYTGNGGVNVVVGRDEFKVEEGESTVARRTQIPLILSWAISIHKSQGQTLERLRVNLSGVWEAGMLF